MRVLRRSFPFKANLYYARGEFGCGYGGECKRVHPKTRSVSFRSVICVCFIFSSKFCLTKNTQNPPKKKKKTELKLKIYRLRSKVLLRGWGLFFFTGSLSYVL